MSTAEKSIMTATEIRQYLLRNADLVMSTNVAKKAGMNINAMTRFKNGNYQLSDQQRQALTKVIRNIK